MTPKEIERLEVLAKAATPGPWKQEQACYITTAEPVNDPEHGKCMVEVTGYYGQVDERIIRRTGPISKNHKYIAAANPKTVLALIDKTQSDDVKLKRTVNAAYHALLEMSAWMGIPEKKRMKQIYYLMENVKYCAENDLRKMDKLNPLPEDDQ